MSTDRFIDFTRNDIGWWLLWVIFPLLALTSLRKRHFVEGFRKATKSVFGWLLVGAVISALCFCLISLWRYFTPQYFTELHFKGENVQLRFHWPLTPVDIPIHDLRTVAVGRSSNSRRPRLRLHIEAGDKIYQSFGFSQLATNELLMLDVLREQVKSNNVVAPKW